MAGALTANAVTTRTTTATITTDPTPIADVALLSPTDGANNVLLKGVVIMADSGSVDSITYQWYRCTPGATVAADILGIAIGPAWTINATDGPGFGETIKVLAIDNKPGYASAYVLTADAVNPSSPVVALVYVDAVLYD